MRIFGWRFDELNPPRVFRRAPKERGIAKELFSFAEQKAKELDLKKLSLLVDFENPKAKALYERLGFKDNEILKVSGSNFYHMIKQLDL